MSRIKLIIELLIVLVIMSSLRLGPDLEFVHKAQAVTTNFTLYAAYSGWNFSQPSGPNPTITVTRGDSISFDLIGEDSLPHLLLLDFDGNGVTNDCAGPGPDKCSGNIPAMGTGSIPPFIVTANQGTYFYYCLYHSPYAMVGKLIVQPPPGPDYGVSASPSSLTILQGANANSTVSITSLNNFAGSVTLSAAPPASWSPPLFSVNPVTVSAGMASTSKLTIYVPLGTSPGPYSVTVTARNSTTFSHLMTVAVTVPTPDFTVTPGPASLTINSGSSGISTLTVTGSNGFSGTVILVTSVPSGSATTMLSSTSVMLSPTATSATSTLTVSSALGAFNVTVTATSGATNHSTKVSVSGPDFSITTSPTTLSVNQGSSSTLTVTLSGVNGFSGSVALSATISSGGPPVTVSPASLQVPSSGTVSATLKVIASTSGAYSTPVSPGSYTITLNETMGSLSHSQTIPLTVTSPSSGAEILTNPVVIGGIVVAVVIVAIAVYALRRKPKR